jgi:ADP-ribose pyrophosphatase YjhB (NUDIX family)
LKRPACPSSTCAPGPFTNDIFEDEKKHYVTLFVIADQTTGDARVKEPDKCERWGWFRWSEMPTPHFLPIANLLAQNFSIAECTTTMAASILKSAGNF